VKVWAAAGWQQKTGRRFCVLRAVRFYKRRNRRSNFLHWIDFVYSQPLELFGDAHLPRKEGNGRAKTEIEMK